jgi:hypothetical protein
MKFGIAFTEGDSSIGSVRNWKRDSNNNDLIWDSYADALEANDLDGWRGYVRVYPSGEIVPQTVKDSL